MNVYLTIDTEMATGLYRTLGKDSVREVFNRSIRCTTPTRDVGVGYQMDVLDRHGLKAVFFVDPMPALVFGQGIVREMVQPILERGHDVQLHLHSEWLKYAEGHFLEGRKGDDIKNYDLADQVALIGYARDALIEAGAPAPVAFRAGNYGANDDTLRALALNQITYDSSFCPGIEKSNCDIQLPPSTFEPVMHCGVLEVPIGAIESHGQRRRHAQLTALSFWEMRDAIRYRQQAGYEFFTLVSHSFEMMSRDRRRANVVVARRFERLCKALGQMEGVQVSTYRDAPPVPVHGGGRERSPMLPHRYIRTVARYGEQAISNCFFGAK